MDYRRKIAQGLGANGFGQIITIAIQLLSVPLYLSFWSAEHYGRWLLLTAFQTYIAMADVGVFPVMINRMTMYGANKEYKEVNKALTNGVIIVAAIALGVMSIVGVGVYVAEYCKFINETDAWVVLLMSTLALICMSSSLIDGIFRAADYYAAGTYILSFARLCEWGGGILGLILTKEMIWVVLGMLLARVFVNLIIFIYAYKKFEFIRFRLSLYEKSYSIALSGSGVQFMAYPIGNALSIQGVSMAIGYATGPVNVTIYNTARTLTRIIVQSATLVQRSLWPEFSKAWGKSDYGVVSKIYRDGLRVSIFISILLGVVIVVGGGDILKYWTQDQVSVEFALLLMLVLAAIINSFWQIPVVALTAANQHQQTALGYMLCSALPVAVVIVFNLSLLGAASALCLFELVFALYAAHKYTRHMIFMRNSG